MRYRNSAVILEGLSKGDRDEYKVINEKKETKIDEVKAYDVKAMAKYAMNVISNKFNFLNVELHELKAEGNDFFIVVTFLTKTKLTPNFEERLATDLASNYLIPTSTTGQGFTVSIIEQLPVDAGYVVRVEIYN